MFYENTTALSTPQPTQAFKHRDDMKVDTFVRVSKYLHIYIL